MYKHDCNRIELKGSPAIERRISKILMFPVSDEKQAAAKTSPVLFPGCRAML
jgi:hypothetical protein